MSLPTSPLATRSAVVHEKPLHVTCRRCAKRISEDKGPVCDKKENVKCSYCTRLHKECLEVPVAFNKRMNEVYRMAQKYENADHATEEEASALVALGFLQAKFKKDLEAYTRAQGRKGGATKPKSTLQVGLLLLDIVERLAVAQEAIADMMRAQMGLPSGDLQEPAGSSDDSSDSDPDEDAGDAPGADEGDEWAGLGEDDDEDMEDTGDAVV